MTRGLVNPVETDAERYTDKALDVWEKHASVWLSGGLREIGKHLEDFYGNDNTQDLLCTALQVGYGLGVLHEREEDF